MHAVLKLVVLISGNGSNLQAIIEQIHQGRLNAEIALVISNRDAAPGLQLAARAHLPTCIIRHNDYATREAFDQALMQAIDQVSPDLVVLAGFMRILSDEFVTHYLGKMINIHPSLLPKYQGLHTHQRVIEARDKTHGATVHYVTPELDSGPIILQGQLEVSEGETAQQLAARVHEIEHLIYPEAIRRIAASQVTFSNGMVYFEQEPITAAQQCYPVLQNQQHNRTG